jgi:hypothetical protein
LVGKAKNKNNLCLAPNSLSLSLRIFVFGIFVFSLLGGEEGVDRLGEGVMKPNPLLDRYLVPTPAPTRKKEKERKKWTRGEKSVG